MADQGSISGSRVLGVFTIAMLNVAVICTLRGLPMMAEEGFALVFYYAVAACVFLIPVSLVSAELATGWPPHGPGGVYIWVNEAFGNRVGFLAIWLQWIQNVIWFPTVLSFIGATLAYIYDPGLASNKLYMLHVILVAYWGGTFINFRGMKTSGMVSTVCVIAGTLFPGMLIIVLGVVWLSTGGSSQIGFSARSAIPDLGDIDSIVFLAGAMLIFSGMEVSAVHANSVRDPKRDFPRAIFISAVIALVVLTLGSLSIAVVVPRSELSLVAGIMEAFHKLFEAYRIDWLVPVIALFIAVGSIGELCTWIAGPSKGLHSTAKYGNLPPFLQHVNRNGVATHILIVQGFIVTAFAFVFMLMPTVSSSYWILSALCVLLYMIMYVLLFSAAIRLRYSRPNVPRAYTIPGGNFGIWLVGGVGILGALFTMVIGFFPPSQLRTGSVGFYESFLAIGLTVFIFIPFLILQLKKPGWLPEEK